MSLNDLLARGGLVNFVWSLVQDKMEGILDLLTIIELSKLEGRSKFDFQVKSIISIWNREIVKTEKLKYHSSSF